MSESVADEPATRGKRRINARVLVEAMHKAEKHVGDVEAKLLLMGFMRTTSGPLDRQSWVYPDFNTEYYGSSPSISVAYGYLDSDEDKWSMRMAGDSIILARESEVAELFEIMKPYYDMIKKMRAENVGPEYVISTSNNRSVLK